MKERQLTQDQLAKFMARQLLKVKQYNFDMFYDIAKLVNEAKQRKMAGFDVHEPDIKDYFLCLRSTGSDLAEAEDNLKQAYMDRSDKVYKISICFNADYLYNVPFCVIKTIK